MAGSLPLISIVIPTYNRVHYIGQAIASVVAQTYSHWEIIVVDDGSTDDTAALIQTLAQRHTGTTSIRYLTTDKPASGPSHARNIGIAAAQGAFVMFLDSDDVYYPDALETLYQAHLAHPDKGVIQGFYSSVDEALNPIRTQGLDLIPTQEGGYRLPYGDTINWMTFIRGELFCSLTTCLFKRTLLTETGPLNENLTHWEDFEYFMRVFQTQPDSILPVPLYIVKYRHQQQSTSRSPANINLMLGCYLRVLDQLFALPNLPSTAMAYRAFAYARIFRVVARIQLINHRSPEARQIAVKALTHPTVTITQWVLRLGPIVAQSFLPATAYDTLADWNRAARLKWKSMTYRPVNVG